MGSQGFIIMKKFLFLVLLLIIIGGAALFYFLTPLLNKGVKTAVEQLGPDMTGTEVRLDEVNISALSGKGSLSGFFVGSPAGFHLDKTFYLGEIEVAVDPASLLSDTIKIERIYIRQPEIVYEKNLKGDNINQIIKNVNSYLGVEEGESPDTGEGAEAGKEKKVEIGELILEEGQVTASIMGNAVKLPLPRVELHDIGRDSGGVTAVEAVQQVLQVIIGQVTTVAADAGRDILQGGDFDKDSLKKKAEEGIKSLFNFGK